LRASLLALLTALAPAIAGCSATDLAVGAGATVATAASEERGLGQTADDDRIGLDIQAGFVGAGQGMFTKVDVSVQEARVLLTGRVEKPELRVEAVRIAWQVDGVAEVIDRIEVAEPEDFGGYVDDLWLAEKLRAKILLDSHVRSINYNIDCVAGTIYLMGVAQDASELQRVVDHARDVPYVRGVVSYVRLKNDPARGAPSAQVQPATTAP
jgi:osmotically-inducible protein OsmY